MLGKFFSFTLLLLFSTHVHSLFSNFGQDSSPDYQALQAELDIFRTLWEITVGDASYEMTISRQCFCFPPEFLGPFTLTVENNAITNVDPDNGFSDGLPTIEGLFDRIQQAIDDEVDALTVSYDTTLGFPTNVFIDQDFRIADEEIGYEVTNVVLISDPNTSTCSFPPVNVPELIQSLSDNAITNGFSVVRYAAALRSWTRYAEKNGCSYTYKLTRSCFCLPDFVGPFIITVENEVIVSAIFEVSSLPVPANVLSDLPTITELFDIILEEANDADAVEIDYDITTGVPTRAFFDRIIGAIDDEITYLAELL